MRPESTTLTSGETHRVRPGILLAIGGGLALAIGLFAFTDWKRETATDAQQRDQQAALTVGAEAAAARHAEELKRLHAEHRARLSALQSDFDAQLAASGAGPVPGDAAGAALQREHEALLAQERVRNEARLAAQQAAYEAELAALRAAAAEPIAADPPRSVVEQAAPPAGTSLEEFARSEEVALALGPFLEPGYAQLDNTFSDARLTFSLEQLRATGALEDSEEGWRTMHKIATSRRDVARTRWPSVPGDDGLERIRRAQRLLRDLGPPLVACGLLRP